jgi:hypothetical protein
MCQAKETVQLQVRRNPTEWNLKMSVVQRTLFNICSHLMKEKTKARPVRQFEQIWDRIDTRIWFCLMV